MTEIGSAAQMGDTGEGTPWSMPRTRATGAAMARTLLSKPAIRTSDGENVLSEDADAQTLALVLAWQATIESLISKAVLTEEDVNTIKARCLMTAELIGASGSSTVEVAVRRAMAHIEQLFVQVKAPRQP